MKKLQFIALLMVLFGMSRLSAQITSTPYMLMNGQSCDITVAYKVTDCVNGLCSNGSLVLNPGVPYFVPCGNPGDDIYVIVTHMNYIPIGGAGACQVSTPGGCIGLPSTNSTPLTAAELTALIASGCPTPTGNCYIISTGSYTKVGY
jgi:hypothetical protein